MSISKKSIIGGLGLALSLASGLAQAGQECNRSQNYESDTLVCFFTLNSVPGKKTISFNIDALHDDIRVPTNSTPVVWSSLYRGQSMVYRTNDGFAGGPARYTFNKTYSYRKGTLGQFNYTLDVKMLGESRAASRLKVTTNR